MPDFVSLKKNCLPRETGRKRYEDWVPRLNLMHVCACAQVNGGLLMWAVTGMKVQWIHCTNQQTKQNDVIISTPNLSKERTLTGLNKRGAQRAWDIIICCKIYEQVCWTTEREEIHKGMKHMVTNCALVYCWRFMDWLTEPYVFCVCAKPIGAWLIHMSYHLSWLCGRPHTCKYWDREFIRNLSHLHSISTQKWHLYKNHTNTPRCS